MKLGSSEMFGRGRHEASDEEASTDEATVDGTTATQADYAGDPTAAQPTFTPADDSPETVHGEVVGDEPVTAADDDLAAGQPTRRSRMAFERPADAGQATAYEEPEAFDQPAAVDEPTAYDRTASVDEPEAFDRPAAVDETAEYDRSVADYGQPDYNQPAGQAVPPVPGSPVEASTADETQQADSGYRAVEADEPTVPTGSAAGVPAPRQAPATPGSALTAGPMSDLDQPLFSDNEFQTQWQRVQAGFVDDPRVAVSEAADLVEHAGQVLADALRERQTRLRALWDTNSAANGTQADPAAAGLSDTEELRLMMRRYRGLFDQLSHL
jgi:hypothetical protein